VKTGTSTLKNRSRLIFAVTLDPVPNQMRIIKDPVVHDLHGQRDGSQHQDAGGILDAGVRVTAEAVAADRVSDDAVAG
jgi:hypothetical protein